jgi:hypothetical protein
VTTLLLSVNSNLLRRSNQAIADGVLMVRNDGQ